ncbi:MAG: methionyl-tRNA formyltransferase [Bdellovibrionaceae bacterium]|nr:methionyl-tRNA formyltransferase [Pseudobdellovibrionaceae bacterium]
MSRVRVCFLGTPDFAVTCLKALLDDEHFEVVGVVTQPDRPAGRKLQLTPSPVKALATAKGLRVVAPESLKDNPLIVDEILRWGAEVAVVVAFGQILDQKFLDSFNLGCVNVHASLLPRWRGAAPIQRAIEAGDAETGVALQKMVRKLDAGAVIGERRIEISPEINSLELHDQLALLGADLLRVELMDYVRGNVGPQPQDESQVTYAKKIDKSESLLDWSQSAETLHNKVRAFVWGPGTYVLHGGKRLKIHKTKIAERRGSLGSPGQVLAISATGVVVACGEGSLELLEVQPESRNRMSAVEFGRTSSLEQGYKFDERL